MKVKAIKRATISIKITRANGMVEEYPKLNLFQRLLKWLQF